MCFGTLSLLNGVSVLGQPDRWFNGCWHSRLTDGAAMGAARRAATAAARVAIRKDVTDRTIRLVG